MKFEIGDADSNFTPLPIREATITFRLEGDMVDRITRWIEGEPSVTMRSVDRERLLREEFEV